MDPCYARSRLKAASPAMIALLRRVAQMAASDAPVIIQGETGTGKELVAEALHDCSARTGPLVVVDCAALPPELTESELFGHVRGAFTGAEEAREGAFLAAKGGTLFIDELGELPLALQPKLLRVLETREVKPVGANRRRPVDARIVAATNRQLEDEVAAGRFRADLYHRLRVFSVEIPPLRDRPEDIQLLAEAFLAPMSPAGRPLLLSEAVRAQLQAHAWPGNVRELKNVIERGAALSEARFRLPPGFSSTPASPAPTPVDPTPPNLSSPDLSSPAPARPTAPSPPLGGHTRPLWEGRSFKDAKARVLEDFERGYLSSLLSAHQGNVSAAAREAGIHRNVFHRMIRRLGLERAAALSADTAAGRGGPG